MESLTRIDEIFGTPLNEVVKETSKNTNEGWKIFLGISLVAAAGIATYHCVKFQQNKTEEK